VDLWFPRGVAAGVLYSALLLVFLWYPRRRFLFLLGTSASGLVVLNYFLSSPGGVPWMAIMNRGLSLVVIWTTVLLLLLHDRATRAQAQWAALVKSSNDAIIGKTLDGFVVNWNTAAERMFGYRAEEMIGKPIAVLIPPDHLGEEVEIMKLIQQGEHIEHLETHRWNKDGQNIHVSLTISPIKDRVGDVVGISTIARDITQQKRAQAEREEMIQQLKDALDKVTVLSGLLPICSSCKKIRDDKGYWNQIEAYITDHSEATFTHGVCPECFARLYPHFKPQGQTGSEDPNALH
jgi:PAS domain S-box-containing protein